MDEHISQKSLEEYSLDKMVDASVVKIEEHLLICQFCRARLEAMEPFNYVHFTADGPIYSRITRLATGEVMARHWGKDLRGGKLFRTVSEGKRYLTASFAQMFPEHTCGAKCGPTREHENFFGTKAG